MLLISQKLENTFLEIQKRKKQNGTKFKPFVGIVNEDSKFPSNEGNVCFRNDIISCISFS